MRKRDLLQLATVRNAPQRKLAFDHFFFLALPPDEPSDFLAGLSSFFFLSSFLGA